MDYADKSLRHRFSAFSHKCTEWKVGFAPVAVDQRCRSGTRKRSSVQDRGDRPLWVESGHKIWGCLGPRKQRMMEGAGRSPKDCIHVAMKASTLQSVAASSRHRKLHFQDLHLSNEAAPIPFGSRRQFRPRRWHGARRCIYLSHLGEPKTKSVRSARRRNDFGRRIKLAFRLRLAL